MKRFTDTNKWEDEWYFNLSPVHKVLWQFICDKCDSAGVWKASQSVASMAMGQPVDIAEALKAFDGRIQVLGPEKWWIKKFVQFQYGRLSVDCNPHKSIIKVLNGHGISIESTEQNERPGELSIIQRLKIIGRDGLTCCYSGKQVAIEDAVIDHIIPPAKGGTNDPSNLVVSCLGMHTLKANYMVDVFCELAGLDFRQVMNEIVSRISKPVAITNDATAIRDEITEKQPVPLILPLKQPLIRVEEKDKEKVLTVSDINLGKNGSADGKKGTKAKPSLLTEVVEFCVEIGLTKDDAEWFWYKCEGCGWKNDGRPIADWQATIRSWKKIKIMPSQKNGSAPSLGTVAAEPKYGEPYNFADYPAGSWLNPRNPFERPCKPGQILTKELLGVTT